MAIIRHRLDRALGQPYRRRRRMFSAWRCIRYEDTRTGRGTGIDERQVERERAAHAGFAAQLDLAAEQAGQLATDRQPKAGAAVLAAGRGIGLLERLEDDALLLRLDTDAGI